MLSPQAHRRWIIAIVLIALLIRVGWVLSRPAGDDALAALPDQREYLDLGRSLLEGRGLHFYDERFRAVVYAYRMPLYPALIAGCFADVRAVRLVQAAMDASTVLAVALLAMALLPPERRRGASVIAAAIVALNPFLIYFTGLVLSETLFTAMLAWGMLLLIVGAKGGRLTDRDAAGDLLPHRPRLGTLLWLIGGLVIAGSTLARPSAAPLAVILGIAATFAARPPRGSGVPAFRVRWPLPVATTMLLLTVAVLAPWAWRNSTVIGHWLWTTSNSGVTAWDGFNPDATGASDQSGLRMMPQLASMNEVERSTYLSSRATDYIRQNPRHAAELAAIKAGRTWSPMPLSADYGNWMYRLAGLGYALPFDLLVLAGICAAPIRRSAKAFLLAPAVYFTLVHMASVGSLRYRVPVEPPLAVLAAAGATMIGVPKLGWRRKE
jgi:hypothetical protein